MKISIITVTFNDSEGLLSTIQSVLSQNYQDLEYIIIDGGSSDNTLEIIDKYRNNISVFVSEPDDGTYDAMRKGLSKASGDWVNYMNAGDTFVSSGVVSGVASLVSKSVEPDVIYGDHIYSYNDKEELRCADIKKIYSTICLNHQSMFYRRAVLSRYSFDPQFEIVADCAQHIRAFREGCNFIDYGEPIAKFIGGGAHSVNKLKTIIEFMLALVKYSPKINPLLETEILKLFLIEIGIKNGEKMSDSRDFNLRLLKKIDELRSTNFFLSPIRKYKLYRGVIRIRENMKKVGV
jgi:glycosyltransferase involved in cell wall biosynthesis